MAGFYRSERTWPVPGSGLELSIVSTVVMLPASDIVVQYARLGCAFEIRCQPRSRARTSSRSAGKLDRAWWLRTRSKAAAETIA